MDGRTSMEHILTEKTQVPSQGINYPSATLSTTNPTWTGLGLNWGIHGERSATSCLSHDVAVLNTDIVFVLI